MDIQTELSHLYSDVCTKKIDERYYKPLEIRKIKPIRYVANEKEVFIKTIRNTQSVEKGKDGQLGRSSR